MSADDAQRPTIHVHIPDGADLRDTAAAVTRALRRDQGYAMPNAHTAAAERLSALGALYDGWSTDPIARTGMMVGPCVRALDVGTGNGGVAALLSAMSRHLADVEATDIDLTHVPDDIGWTSGVDVREHDITRDPLPDNAYDVIHARCVVQHCPDPLAVIDRLVAALRPGGMLVLAELDPVAGYATPTPGSAGVVIDYVGRAFSRYLAAAGADVTLGRDAHIHLERAGLTAVDNVGHVAVANRWSPARALMRANIRQCADGMVRDGFVADWQVAAFLRAIDDPAVSWWMPTLFVATGRRPVE